MEKKSQSEPERNENELIARLLRPLDSDAAPIRQDVIDRATQLAGEEFSKSTNDAVEPKKDVQDESRGRTKSVLIKVGVALSAVAASLLIVIASMVGTARADITLGWILDRTFDSNTLQLKIIKDGVAADVWVRSPGNVRWEESGSRYQIATGSQLWRVDEKANTVESMTSPWFQDQNNQVDLLALLGLNEQQASAFRVRQPQETVQHNGKSCQVFQLTVTDNGQQLLIKAFADAKTNELYTIAAWHDGVDHGPPSAELRLVARDIQIDESKFVVATTLSADGRIGKIVDSQGIVTLRPMIGSRWTPVARQMIVKPGDWWRTDVRGANASTVITTGQFQLIAGPGSLIELQGPNRLKLHSGEVNISGGNPADGVFELVGPDDQKLSVKAGESVHYRIDRRDNQNRLTKVPVKPVWLAGFEGSSNNESIGSLICNIDGRSTSLTVGFHKVKVEIRDQIARTTIEESFVNHTTSRLEGVFHFPLPQDASISGFGMWINGELIEADVVEKQRAREIYETILREKRDPGLLEWAGGNIFKARIFPILPHSEKRIRIVYTQVLPLRANRYRYSYSLRSELLQTTPLRELSLEVLVSSALPLKNVTCSTHDVRSQLMPHSAKLEFTAQEYTPTRDFEVVCEVDSNQSDVVVVPHRRGEDGYFLVQLTPPGAEGNWQREILSEGKPLELLLICDTSGSMDSEKREQQENFVASILASLGPADHFNLAVCDVNCDWLHDVSISPSQDSTAKALDWLNGRISLGWTDLDRMTASVLSKLDGRTHVIYIGDGIVTAHDADPQSFANRLNRITAETRSGTFHAVSVGNSFESTVLKALSQVGGGSVRQIGGERSPQMVAFELLNEIAQPGLRDLKVEFRGLQVAAVYPETLSNLPAGTQQILIGRYLPQGTDQTGEIVITGQRNGETVRYASRVTFADAQAGNSFIPRLWARAHLDSLLEQGTSQFVQDEIISLSEEFHIITPYTSLLVLETDEDRERFGVKRRYQMRDGERFFTEGSDKAKFELLAQQMKRAGDWRLGLRRQILLELSRLGRDAQLFQQIEQRLKQSWYSVNGPIFPNAEDWLSRREMRRKFIGNNRLNWNSHGGLGGITSADFSELEGLIQRTIAPDSWERSRRAGAMRPFPTTLSLITSQTQQNQNQLSVDYFHKKDELSTRLGQLELLDRDSDGDGGFEWDFNGDGLDFLPSEFDDRRDGKLPSRRGIRQLKELKFAGLSSSPMSSSLFRSSRSLTKSSPFSGGGRGYYDQYNTEQYIQWLHTLFPAVSVIPATTVAVESEWPDEAIAISKSLLQPISIENGGIEVNRLIESADPRWNRTTARTNRLDLYSPQRWLSLAESAASQTQVQWCDEQHRGIYSRAFQLGRVRKSHSRDLESLVPGQRAYATTALHTTFTAYDVEIQSQAGGQILLTMTYAKNTPAMQMRVLIDTAMNVVLNVQWLADDKPTTTTQYSDYVQAAGIWWPGKIESFDAKGRRTSITTQTVTVHGEDAFNKRFDDETPGDQAQLLSMPLPLLRAAEIAAKGGSADFEHRLVLLLKSCLIQDWEEALKQLGELEKTAPNKPGNAWIRAAVLIAARKNEDARQLLRIQADSLVAKKTTDELYLASYVLDQLNQISDQNELLRLLNRLRPVFERQPEISGGLRIWNVRRARALRSLGRTSEVLELQRNLAAAAPWDTSAQTIFARDLANAGELEAAWAWLREEIDRDVERNEYETNQLRNLFVTLLREQGRDEELVTFFEEWDATNPANQSVYQQYLNALDMADRTDDADAKALQWLQAGRVAGKLDQATLMRLNAAAAYAGGQRYRTSMNWIEPSWLKPLEETAQFFLDHEHHFSVASAIIDNHYFRESDESDRLKLDIARRLETSASELDLVALTAFVRWTVNRNDLSVNQWQDIATTLRKRWDEMDDSTKRPTLGAALIQIYSVHFRDSDHLPFMREQVARAEREENAALKTTFVNALFTELLSRDWQDKYESEAFLLIVQLSVSEHGSQRLVAQVSALHRFVDRMLQARFQADWKQLQDKGHPEKLTRTELSAKQSEFQKAAREGLAARLAEESNQLVNDGFREWVRAERMYIDLRLDRNENQVADECWTILGEAPIGQEPDDEILNDAAAEASRLRAIQGILRERAFAMVNYIAVRRSASPQLVERLQKYVLVGTRLDGDIAVWWKQIRFALLVALDKPDELEGELRKWIQADEFPVDWQLSLGKLLAERGKIDEAIALFETVERTSHILPSGYAALADWYLVTDRRDQYKRAKIEVFKSMEEYNIQRWLQQKRQPWYQSEVPLPTELDENVLFAFQALFEKSNQPGNYANQLKDFYTACRDFRLLKMIPDSLTGRTPQQVYPFLKSLRSNVLSEIRKEATADELLKRLAEVRSSIGSTPNTAIDLRALDLLESMVERQAAELLNQPGPHVDAALVALVRAFNHEWAEGEIRQMADLLNDLGRITQKRLNEERLRQLRELHRMTSPGTEDRFLVAWYLSSALFWSHDQRQQGLSTMEIAVREIESANPDGWPAQLNTPLDGYISMLESDGRFAVGEKLLKKLLARPLNGQQQYWLAQRQNQLFHRALQNDGQVSLGAGTDLFVNLEQHLLDQAETTGDSYRQQVLTLFLQVYRTVQKKNIASYQNHFRKFAFEILPPILARQTNNYRDIVKQTSETVRQLLGARDALAFLIDRFETYPGRFERTWESSWSEFAYKLALWRMETGGDLGDLEPRLLAIVLKELRRDLLIRNTRNYYFYRKTLNGHFWTEKENDFYRIAEEVLQEHIDSGRSVTYVAQYLYSGLLRKTRAIEIMLTAHRKKLLDTAQQIILCDFLHGTNRHGESISILEPIVEASSDLMQYRTRLITAYNRSSQTQQMKSLVTETGEYFRQGGRWTEGNIAQLAQCCLNNELFGEAAGFYGEVIPLHQRTQPNRGVGNGTLSSYYELQSRAYSGMGETILAVDSAAASVVASGPNRSQRDSAAYSVERVLSESKDLDDYVAHLDKQVDETGQDSPLIRQKLGVVFAKRGQHQKAIMHFQAAIQLQPTDMKTHEELIKAYDAVNDNESAVRQTLAMLDFDRHNLELYKKLNERLKSDEALFERAATSIVEAAPQEAEHHQALAEIRQDQDRWDDAIDHWQHVARLRALEPNGLLKLTEALIHEKRWGEARDSIETLNQRQWPSRFSNVQTTTNGLQRQIPELK